MRVYIAGPIAGDPDARANFTRAARELLAQKRPIHVINPLDVTPDDHEGDCPPGYPPGEGEHAHTSSACFMRADLRALLTCDEIHMLPGWRNSKGATIEHAVAVACGMTITGAKS